MNTSQSQFTPKYIDLVPQVWEFLKTLERTGWALRDIPKPETVFDHIASMDKLARDVLSSSELFNQDDQEIIFDMIEIHDWAEYIVGDLVVFTVPKKERDAFNKDKHAQEKQVMQELCASLGEEGVRIYSLWEEYEESTTPRAQFVKQIDKLQAVLQAAIYERQHHKPGLALAFVKGSGSMVSHPALTPYLEKIKMDTTLERVIPLDPLCPEL